MKAVKTRAGLAVLVLCAMTGSPATVLGADAPEPFPGTIEAVNVAARQVQADGQLYALSSTVSITLHGSGASLGLQNLRPGMQALILLGSPGEALPVIRSLSVIPD
ncbi:MAG: hypothetical protein KJ041_02915 [Gammaproteobacteria bacterium]|nr:hypothetical protein [Gammaproteobacteria bacterium]